MGSITGTVTDGLGGNASWSFLTTPYQAFTLGQTTILATPDSGNGGLIAAQPITITAALGPSTVTSLSFYVATAGGNLRLGIYGDAAGKPGTKLAEAAEFTPVVGWNTKPLIASVFLQPGNYWLAFFPQSNTLAFRKTATGALSYFKTLAYGALPVAFPGSPSSTGSQWAFYTSGSFGGSIVAQSGVGGLPAGVTLRAIDGGQTYYATNGFTNAVNMGWDTPAFFPIGPFDSRYQSANGDPAVWTDLGWNTAFADGGLDLALTQTNGVSVVQQNNVSELSNVVGNSGMDEPEQSAATAWGNFIGQIQTLANSIQDHKFWSINLTWNWMVWPSGTGVSPDTWVGAPSPKTTKNYLATAIATPNATTRHQDLNSVDIYWFTSSRTAQGGWSNNFVSVYPQSATLANALRGSNYGDLVDQIRAFQSVSNGGFPAPITIIIENGQPFSGEVDATNYIRSEEINWAVWSSIIHGARLICYFDHTFSGPGQANNNLSDNPSNFYKTTQNGSSVTVYDQVKATDSLVAQLAPVINSPFAINFASVSPNGYTFPTPTGGFDPTLGYAQQNIQNGIEVCTHYYNQGASADNKFYIFATTRNAKTDTNISATFTVAAGTLATVINESRSINIVGGQFTDTFANAYTVHIYKIT